MYDVIIIGAGAAGLFAGCRLNPHVKALILEKNSKPGCKLMMSGSGQCNLTHGGSIKDFLSHYGAKGKLIRQILYQFSNEMTVRFFEERGVKMLEREDAKIFPESLSAEDVVSCLVRGCTERGVEICCNSKVEGINPVNGGNFFEVFSKNRTYASKYLLIASGGCSYPATGSDGGFFEILKRLGIKITDLKPSLTPVFLEGYPYGELAGISFKNCGIRVFEDMEPVVSSKGDLLFTHQNMSGPVILNNSRWMKPGQVLELNYAGSGDPHILHRKIREKLNEAGNIEIATFLKEYFKIPKRFAEFILKQLQIDKCKKVSYISKAELQAIVNKLTSDRFSISKLGDFRAAMATSGGVALEETDMSTLSSVKYPGLFFAGEVLDVDGDTGGYNIQFAFSSAALCASQIIKRLELETAT